jgi:nicotinamide mononucleotide transporter
LITTQHVLAALAQVTATEWFAVVLALAYLVLAIRQNPWCWACAIVSAALYLVLFARAHLYMQAALQVFYVAMSVYGWRAWGGASQKEAVPVQRWPLRWHVFAIGAIAIVSALNGALVSESQGSPMVPYVDAAIAWGSVFTTWLVARKVLENWWYWIVLDLAAAALYWSQALYATAVLFVLYTVLAALGLRAWRRDAARALPVPA